MPFSTNCSFRKQKAPAKPISRIANDNPRTLSRPIIHRRPLRETAFELQSGELADGLVSGRRAIPSQPKFLGRGGLEVFLPPTSRWLGNSNLGRVGIGGIQGP